MNFSRNLVGMIPTQSRLSPQIFIKKMQSRSGCNENLYILAFLAVEIFYGRLTHFQIEF